MQNKTIEGNIDLRKRVKISIPKLIKEILDKDISYFNIKLEKLCNVIVQEMGYEPLLKIHLKNIKSFILERNYPEIKVFIKNYIKEIIVSKEGIEVTFIPLFSFTKYFSDLLKNKY